MALQTKKIGNIELNYNDNFAVINISLEIFSKESINAAINSIKGKVTASLKNNDNSAIVEIFPKENNEKLEEIAREFNNWLIIHAANNIQDDSKIEESLDMLGQSVIEDPLGIAKLWEEK